MLREFPSVEGIMDNEQGMNSYIPPDDPGINSCTANPFAHSPDF